MDAALGLSSIINGTAPPCAAHEEFAALTPPRETEKEANHTAMRDMVLLLLLAVAYRLAFLAAMPRVLDTADAIHYLEAARVLARGDFWGYDPKIPLLYPLLTALAHTFIANIEHAGMLVSFLASCLTLLPVYALARALHGTAAARIAAIAVALWPWLADYAWRVGNESLGVLLWLLGALWLGLGARTGGWRPIAGVLALFALALTRAEGLFILLAAFPLAAIGAGPGALRRLAIPAALALALVALNTLYVRALTGEVSANHRVGFILAEFDVLRFAHTAAVTLTDVLPIMLGPVLLLFLGAGLFMQRPTPRDARLEFYFLALAATQWCASLFVLSPAPRYLMATLIVLTTWSAAGMVLVAAQLRPLSHGRWLARLPLFALIATMLLHTAITVGAEHLDRRPREPREYKAAGLWLRENAAPDLLFTRKPQIAFYANMPSTGPLDTDTLDEALARARAAGCRYLAVDERYAPPGIRPLLDPAAAPPGLRLLHIVDHVPQSRVVLYELELP